MRNILYFFTLFLLGIQSLFAQKESKVFSLKEVIAIAKEQSTAAKIAESIKENRYYQYLGFKAMLRPQLSLSGNLLGYSKDYLGVVQPDGTLIFQPRTQNYSNLGLSLSQQIGITGGTIAVNSSLARFDDLDRNQKRYSGIPVNISLNQPLFGFTNYKWDKQIEPLKYEEAEKDYFKESENISFQVSKLYFNVIDAQAEMALAKKNIENQKIILDIENKRIDLGTTSKDRILQIKLQLLRSTQDLSAAEVNLKAAIYNLKSYTGLNNDLSVSLTLPVEVPLIKISVERAIEAAKANRAEFVAYRRRKLEAEKDLDYAKKERFKINLTTTYGYNNAANALGDVYTSPNSQQTLTLGVQLPILDWGRNKGKISVAVSNLKTVKYTIEQEEIAFIQEITYLVENLKLISDNITIAKQTDQMAQERYELVAEQFRFGKFSITELNIALDEKDNSKRSFISTLRSFWQSYYQLRLLTLIEI